MRVNFISETEFFPTEHGVHSAYFTTVQMVRDLHVDVIINSSDEADIVHVQTVGLFGLYKLMTGKKTVVSAHLIPSSFLGSLKGARYWLGISKRYLKFFYNQADLVLAVSESVLEELKKMGVKKRIEIFSNPINTSIFKKDNILRIKGRKLLKIQPGETVVIGVGQLQPRKGIADFIEVARALPETKFIWIGNKPFKSLTAGDVSFENILKNHPLNFFQYGPFSYEQMPAIYNSADIFLFPSFQENAPMGVLEAAAIGLPLVLRDNREYRSLYANNYIACRDIEEFRREITKLIKDKVYYKNQIRKSKALAERFTTDVLGAKLVGLYKQLLEK